MALSLTLLSTQPGHAQDGTDTVSTSVDYEFGASLEFSASVENSKRITRATVFYLPSGMAMAEVLEADLTGATGVTATATLDLRAEPLRPFVEVVHWWQIDFEDGSQVRTEQLRFRYTDNRFHWQSASSPPVSVYWVEGDPAFGQTAVEIALESLQRIRNNLLLPMPNELAIYLYPDASALQSALRLGGRNHVAAHAIADLGVVLVVASTGPEGQIELERTIPHELTHVLLYQRMGERYANLPAWLNEGLAALQEQIPNPEYRLALDVASESNTILPLESLCSAFPTVGSESLLAYAQSASIVSYVRDIYGTGGILALLDAYQEGASCLGGIQRVLQRSPAQLDQEWRAASLNGPSATALLAPILPWAILAVPILLIVIYALLAGPSKKAREAAAQDQAAGLER